MELLALLLSQFPPANSLFWGNQKAKYVTIIITVISVVLLISIQTPFIGESINYHFPGKVLIIPLTGWVLHTGIGFVLVIIIPSLVLIGITIAVAWFLHKMELRRTRLRNELLEELRLELNL